MVYYVVLKGYKPGIYTNWNLAKEQIDGFSSAKYKKFKSLNEANYYYKTNGKIFSECQKLTIENNKKKVKDILISQQETNFENYKIKIQNIEDYLEIWTDGSSIHNGKPNCKSSYSVFFSDSDSRNHSNCIKSHKLFGTSNQRAELYAIYKAIKLSRPIKKIKIYTDSMYSIECITNWSKSWEKNNWKNSKNEPVKHSDIIKKILKYMNSENIEIKFVHVNSHTKKPSKLENPKKYKIWYGNFKADLLAKKALSDSTHLMKTSHKY